MSLLAARDLRLELPAGYGRVMLLGGVDLDLARGERLGLVGESGSGKTMTALAVMGLQPDHARLTGSIRLDGAEMLGLDDRALCTIRGRRIAMVFQEPMTALNPVQTIGRQIAEGPVRQQGLGRRDAAARVEMLLARVGMPPARFSPDLYPHQLSGGQRQRVMLAMALSCEPDLLIADEPTTALDVTVQAEILRLIDDIVRERAMSLLLITHDLGVIAGTTDRLAVMYAGRVVEVGPTEAVFAHPAHPYTRALMAVRPRELEPAGQSGRTFAVIPGEVPRPGTPVTGCAFAPRCLRADQACCRRVPPLAEREWGRAVACEHPL